MIRYALACDAGHRFESWFRDSSAFDTQSASDLVTCPDCGSRHVAKTVMAPAIALGLSAPMRPDPAAREVALLDPRARDARAALQAVRAAAMSESEDVGARFAEEARRIHDGDLPPRRIRGQATIEQARDLLEDGIPVLPLPPEPDDLN